MKISVPKSDLLAAVKFAAPAADGKATLQILANVLLRASGDGLTCAATDLVIGCAGTMKAEVQKEGGAALPAGWLLDCIKGIPDGKVGIVVDADRKTWIKSGRSEYKVLSMPAADYPRLPLPPKAMGPLDPAALRDLVRRTQYAVGSDDTRQHMAGALWKVPKGGAGMEMVSTDGHRLSLASSAGVAPDQAPGTAGLLVPRRGLSSIMRLVEGREAPVQVGVADGYLHVVADERTLSIKLIDAQFPNYEQIVDNVDMKRPAAVVSRAAFLDALMRVAIIIDEKHPLEIRLGKGSITMHASEPNIGEMNEEIEADCKASTGRVGVNHRYLRQFLEQTDAEKVRIISSGELDPMVVQPDGDGPVYVGIVMPMRLTEPGKAGAEG